MASASRPSHAPELDLFSLGHTVSDSEVSADLANIREFFQYSLPPFRKHKDHITSASTRPPAYFDRHLEDRLRLQRVVYLPSLVNDFGAIADHALTDYLSKRPLPSTTSTKTTKTTFPDLRKRGKALKNSPHARLRREADVENTYHTTIANHCLIVASTLEFQLPVWSSGYLRWTTHCRTEENHAIADGFFEIVDEPDADDKRVPPLPKAYLDVFEYFQVLGVWEFKNLRAGSIAVFESIREQTRKARFPWVGCQAGDFCALHHPTESDDTPKTWSKLGTDAAEPVCGRNLSSPLKLPPQPSHKIGVTHAKHATFMSQQVWAEMVKHDTTFACLNSGHLEIYFKRNRATNTLYITNIIWTDSPGRARVLVGFLIAILRDAKDRAAQLRRSTLRPFTWSIVNPFIKPGIVTLSAEEILREVRTRQWLVLTPIEKKIPTSSFWPDSPYLRISSSSTTLANENTPDFAGPFIKILLHPQRHADKAALLVDGNAFPGIPQSGISEFVIVKNANQKLILRRLTNEYKVLLALAAAHVTCIPDVFGIFGHTNSEEKPFVELRYLSLVVEHVGNESVLAKWHEKKSISEELVLDCLRALKQIHAADYCCGEISLEDLIIRPKHLKRKDRLLVSFVSLGAAYHTTEQRLKDQEFKALVERLENPHKRSTDDLDDPEESPPAKHLIRSAAPQT